MIKQPDLERGDLICNGAMILDDSVDRGLPWFTTLPSGTYLCAYRQYEAMDGGFESTCIKEMLDYIEKHKYRIIGPYIGEVVAETSIFACNDRNLLLRQQIQIQQDSLNS